MKVLGATALWKNNQPQAIHFEQAEWERGCTQVTARRRRSQPFAQERQKDRVSKREGLHVCQKGGFVCMSDWRSAKENSLLLANFLLSTIPASQALEGCD